MHIVSSLFIGGFLDFFGLFWYDGKEGNIDGTAVDFNKGLVAFGRYWKSFSVKWILHILLHWVGWNFFLFIDSIHFSFNKLLFKGKLKIINKVIHNVYFILNNTWFDWYLPEKTNS